MSSGGAHPRVNGLPSRSEPPLSLLPQMAQGIADGAPLMNAAKSIPELSGLAENEVKTRMSNLKEAICSLMEVARVLKKRRFENGALELEGVEVKLILQRVGDNITVEEILPKQVGVVCVSCVSCGRLKARPACMPPGWCPQPLEIHETVAECMIFANHCVAKRVYEAFPSAALVSISSHRTAYSKAWLSHHTPLLIAMVTTPCSCVVTPPQRLTASANC